MTNNDDEYYGISGIFDSTILNLYQSTTHVELIDRIEQALLIAFEYSGVDDARHQQWVIDQMIRKLLDDEYEQWVYGQYVEWDEGKKL